MTIITYPSDKEPELKAILGVVELIKPVEITIRINDEVSEEKLAKLKELGIKYITPK